MAYLAKEAEDDELFSEISTGDQHPEVSKEDLDDFMAEKELPMPVSPKRKGKLSNREVVMVRDDYEPNFEELETTFHTSAKNSLSLQTNHRQESSQASTIPDEDGFDRDGQDISKTRTHFPKTRANCL